MFGKGNMGWPLEVWNHISLKLNVAICKHHFKENFMTYLNKYKYMLVAT